MDVVVVDQSAMVAGALCDALKGFGVAARPAGLEDALATGCSVFICRVSSPSDFSVVQCLASSGAVVTVLTARPTTELTAAALRSGARHVVDECESIQALVAAVTYAGKGGALIPHTCAMAFVDSLEVQVGAPVLCEDERSWLRQLATGSRVHEVAACAGYSEREMFRRLDRVYRSLGASNRVEALLAAQRMGVLAPTQV